MAMAGLVTAALAAGAAGSASHAGQSALRLWSRFPASAKPRPLVPVGEGTVLDPATGFTTGEAKIAYIDGDFKLDTTLPTRPDRADGYRLLTARGGFRLLRSSTGDIPAPAPDGPALKVTIVRLGSGTFETDRGKAKLPAWLFYFAGVKDPAVVLAIAPPEVFYPPTPRRFSGGYSDFEETSATVLASGKQLTVSFFGSPAGDGPCDAAYFVTSVHSAHAVAISLHLKTTSTSVACAEPAYRRSVTFRLTSPLAGRALILASNGGVIPVTREPTRR
jgi:hypothetical protein